MSDHRDSTQGEKNLIQRLSLDRPTIRIPPRPLEPNRAGEQLHRVLSGDLEKDTRNVSRLLETIHAFDSSHDIGEYLDRVVDMVVDLTSADRGILLISEEPGQAKVVAARDREQQTIVKMTRFSHSLVRQVLESGQSVCMEDAGTQTPDVGQSIADLELKTVMCVPLRGRQAVLGVMYVDSRIQAGGFGSEDLQFFEAICHQAAMTIEHARVARYAMESEGLAAMGDVAAQLLTDLSRGAQAIQGSARMLQSFELGAADVKRIGQEVELFVGDMFSMLESMQAYAALAAPGEAEVLDLASLVQDLLEQQRAPWEARNITLQIDAPGPVFVTGAHELLARAVIALADNAQQAMPDGGRLTVRTTPAAEQRVTLTMIDTGAGIPEALLPQVLEPFVSSDRSRRAGLGLSLVQRIITLHGGTVELRSAVGQGTEAILTLPRAATAI